MVFYYSLRDLLPLVLKAGNNIFFSNGRFSGATEVCEQFYDTLVCQSIRES